MSPQGDKIGVPPNARSSLEAHARLPMTTVEPLSAAEVARLKDCEERINRGRSAVEEGFITMVEAMFEVYESRLYRESGRTFQAYFQEKWHFQRAHSYRLVRCGGLLQRMKNSVMGSLKSQAHFRPLLATMDDSVIEASMIRIQAWIGHDPALEITPRVVASAFEIVNPVAYVPVTPNPRIAAKEVLDLVTDAQDGAKKKGNSGIQILENLRKNIESLTRKATTGISWTDDTWNPLQGCKLVSDGCRNCYAAKLLATRLGSKFPGIAVKVAEPRNGSSPYRFTGKVALLHHMLGEPLLQKRPRRYFVNSLSDLFFSEVPEWYVDEVFDVMEKADWHQFQLLTKRPERMATYTKNRYAKKVPPKNIWMGCSVENQREHDRRISHLNEVVTAVRWISAEPLLSKVRFDLSKVQWVVVGGESSGGRRMDKTWATDIRSQCNKASVAFFFKQWGDFGEDGKPAKLKKKGHATLDGKIYHEYPA